MWPVVRAASPVAGENSVMNAPPGQCRWLSCGRQARFRRGISATIKRRAVQAVRILQRPMCKIDSQAWRWPIPSHTKLAISQPWRCKKGSGTMLGESFICSMVTQSTFAGDWRLPNLKGWTSLIRLGPQSGSSSPVRVSRVYIPFLSNCRLPVWLIDWLIGWLVSFLSLKSVGKIVYNHNHNAQQTFHQKKWKNRCLSGIFQVLHDFYMCLVKVLIRTRYNVTRVHFKFSGVVSFALVVSSPDCNTNNRSDPLCHPPISASPVWFFFCRVKTCYNPGARLFWDGRVGAMLIILPRLWNRKHRRLGIIQQIYLCCTHL